MSKRILHIAGCDKFIPPFVEFVKEHFDFDQHEFLLTDGMASHELKSEPNVFLYKRLIRKRLMYYSRAVIKMHQAKKVIFHGLFDIRLVYILFFMPWLLKKCYWIIWGGDLYAPQFAEKTWKWKVKEFFRRAVIKNMGHLVTYIKGDYKLAQKWYGASGQYHECFMYTSNLYKEYDVTKKQHSVVNIMVGNSADPMNNHFEVFDKLEAFKDDEIQIYVPLTYGNKDYAQQVIAEGKQRFGEKFKPLTEHMPFEKYLEFLGLIDIAIFNHRRQQAMGNTITLLGLGKKVFLRTDVTQWDFFKNHGIEVFDIQNLDILPVHKKTKQNNAELVRQYFSRENFIKQLQGLFS
jgi:hypothetical protein